MKAIAVHPGKANSMHLEEIPIPKVSDIPNGQGVLVKVLRVGVDGTDKEISAAEYGNAPESVQFLITGHESFGRVVEVGAEVDGCAGRPRVPGNTGQRRSHGGHRSEPTYVRSAATGLHEDFQVGRG